MSLTTAQVAGQQDPRTPLQGRPLELDVLRGLGVGVRDVRAAEADRWQLGSGGAVIERITTGSPAWRTALRVGDAITTFDGLEVRNARHLSELVRETPPGWAVTATVAREGVTWDIELTVEPLPSGTPSVGRNGTSVSEDELVPA